MTGGVLRRLFRICKIWDSKSRQTTNTLHGIPAIFPEIPSSLHGEEASSAMMEGRIAGLSAAEKVIGHNPGLIEERSSNMSELKEMREGPFGERIRIGNRKLHEEAIKNGLQ